MHGEPVFHICRDADWRAALPDGVYEGSDQDRIDGFIHLSTHQQAPVSAAKHRAGEPGLVLLTVDGSVLGDALKWEPSRGGALFPHLYGPLPVSAVIREDALPVGDDGRHVFPSDFMSEKR